MFRHFWIKVLVQLQKRNSNRVSSTRFCSCIPKRAFSDFGRSFLRTQHFYRTIRIVFWTIAKIFCQTWFQNFQIEFLVLTFLILRTRVERFFCFLAVSVHAKFVFEFRFQILFVKESAQSEVDVKLVQNNWKILWQENIV